MNLKILVIFFVAFSWVPASAEILKWVDEHGEVHFGDKVPDKYKAQSKSVNVSTLNVVKSQNEKKKTKTPMQKYNESVQQRNNLPYMQDFEQMKKERKSREAAWKKSSEAQGQALRKQLDQRYAAEQPCNFRGTGLSKKKRNKLRKQCKASFYRNPN